MNPMSTTRSPGRWVMTGVLGGAALVLGAVGPLVFLVLGQRYSIAPEVAGASSFALAALGMIAGSLLSPAPAKTAAAL